LAVVLVVLAIVLVVLTVVVVLAIPVLTIPVLTGYSKDIIEKGRGIRRTDQTDIRRHIFTGLRCDLEPGGP